VTRRSLLTSRSGGSVPTWIGWEPASSAGAPSVAQDLSRTAQATENLGRAGKDTDRSMGDMTRTVSRTRRETEKAGGSFRKFGGEMLGLRQAAMVALIPAIGLLTQGIGALGSGIGSLLPQLTSLGALAAPVGVGMLGIGTAMLTVKLATNNLSKAMAGNKNALKALTPEGRQFLRTLKEYRPVMDQMRRSAQRGLFPGLDIALRQLQGAVPTVRSMLRGAGASLGQAAAGAARRVTGTGFLSDLEMLGGQGQTLIRRGVTAILNVGDALRHVLVAAMPFTDWLSRTVVQWTRSADAAARLGRQTGRMGDWFLRARDRLAGLFDVVRNLYGVFRGLTTAITPLGDQMWGSIDRVTRRWNDFINSTRGQGDLRRYFASVREPLRQMAGLFGDLARGLGHLAAGSGFANAVAMLRQAVPALVAGLSAMAQTFGPAVVGALTQVVRLFGNLSQHGGAFSTVLGMLTNLVSGFNWMLEHIPALGTLISAALTVSLISRAAGAVGGLAGKWMGVKAAATQAAEAEVAAGTAAAGGGAGGMGATLGALRGRGVRGNLRALRANAGALSTVAAIAAMSAGQAVGGPGGSALTGAGTGAALGATVGSVVPGIGTAVGAVVGGIGGGLLGLLSGGSAQQRQQMQQASAQTQQFLGAGPSAAAIRGRIGGLQGQLRDAQRGYRLDRQGFAVQVNTNPRAVQAQLSALHAALPVQVRIERQQAAQEARAAGQRLAFQFGEAFNIYSRRFGPEKGMDLTRRGVMQQMQRMGREGRLALAQNVITWAREQERQNPKLHGAVGDLVRGIVGQFRTLGQNVAVVNGQILTGSQAQWAKISTAIQGPVEQAQERVTAGFTAMQREALNALKLMGFSPRQAREILSATQAGGAAAGAAQNAVNIGAGATTSIQRIGAGQAQRRHTRGGRIAGQGLMDTVPVAPGNFAAPGELIVNRHTERRVNAMMAAFGTSLGREVAGERRPHFAALGQRVGAAEHGLSANAQRAGLASQVSLSGVHPDVLKAASVVESRFPGLVITSGTGGGHAAGSFHFRGMAVDMGGAPGLMNRAAAWIGTNLGGQLLGSDGLGGARESHSHGARRVPGWCGRGGGGDGRRRDDAGGAAAAAAHGRGRRAGRSG
jgi:chemotaxis regulatin CheY-phosphate phosphatase CheZ